MFSQLIRLASLCFVALLSAVSFASAQSALKASDPANLEEGLYLETKINGVSQFVELSETRPKDMNTGGFGGKLLGRATVAFRIEGEKAEHRITDAAPVFYISGFTPRNVFLVKPEEKDGDREFVGGKVSMVRVSGPKTVADLNPERVAKDVYRLTLSEPLPFGEYGFLIAVQRGLNNEPHIYDFGIDQSGASDGSN